MSRKRKRDDTPEELKWLLKNQPTVYYATNDSQYKLSGKTTTSCRILRNDRVKHRVSKPDAEYTIWSKKDFTVVMVLQDRNVLIRMSGGYLMKVEPDDIRLEKRIGKGGKVKEKPCGFKF